MEIEKIKINNFKCFEGLFEMSFNKGLNIIVGNNEAGKTTIVEAVNLALSGWFKGRYLTNELSQYLFNYNVVEDYLKSIELGKPIELPSIEIEVFLTHETYPEFSGDNNSDTSPDRTGFVLKIEFDEKYREEYEILIRSGYKLKSLPIEYYHFYWRSFSRDTKVTPRLIPIKVALVDSSSERLKNGSDVYISRIVKDYLESREIVDVSQAHRRMKEVFTEDKSIKAINEKIQKALGISDKRIELTVELSSKNAWESSLITCLDNIPFHHIGKGEQCMIKTKLALSHKKAKESSLLLIEEPENHLSFSKLNGLISELRKQKKQIIVTTHSSFVANKLGLSNLILLKGRDKIKLSDLSSTALTFFEKLSGYDTLRLILCKKAILVEGDSDELIVQRAYMDLNNSQLPIQNEIDVISVGTSFLNFLEVAEKMKIPVCVVTDSDGDLEAINKKYKNYLGKNKKANITICFDENIESGSIESFNYNTLEPKLLKVNSVEVLNSVLGKKYNDEESLLIHMRAKKVISALKIFNSEIKLNYPEYICKAIK